MVPTETKPEYVVFTRPTNVTGGTVFITNKGNAFIKGYDDRTGGQNVTLVRKFVFDTGLAAPPLRNMERSIV
jgi:hypothetical protein